MDDADNPIPFQTLEQGRKIAIRTNLPANSRHVWRWCSNGKAQATFSPGVQIEEISEGWEISNELIAIRVPNSEMIRIQAERQAGSALMPILDLFNHGPDVPRVHALAPIQGIRLRDGSWTALGPNALVAMASQLTDAKVELLEIGATEGTRAHSL